MADQTATKTSTVLSLDGNAWMLATDPKNVGRDEEWFRNVGPDARPAKVPFVLQDAFPDYYGLVWYWRDFEAPLNRQPEGRYLLRFWTVHYKADVWVNDKFLGSHEGGEDPFIFDVTDVINPGQMNRLAVRVLNPTHEPIDGIKLGDFPSRGRAVPYQAGGCWNIGGIMDSVELLLTPAVRVKDILVLPDWLTGAIRIQTTFSNASGRKLKARLEHTVAPATQGETLDQSVIEQELPSGDTVIESELAVRDHRLWQLNDPYLYRITARVSTAEPTGVDEYSTRCGFRDFRFERGAFRLNGKRIYPRCAHDASCIPISIEMHAFDPDLFRRDLLNAKTFRLNMVRFFEGMPQRYQLDLCDEIGLLVYEESYAAGELDQPARIDHSNIGMILRDRNHPSVVIWGLLNESKNTPPFRHAIDFLPTLRKYDNTRVVLLNSGHNDFDPNVGGISNPGSAVWENVMGDAHIYPRVPMTAEAIRGLRSYSGSGCAIRGDTALVNQGQPTFFTEGGIGSAYDYERMTRFYEQFGKTQSMDATYASRLLDLFLDDYKALRMDEVFPFPSDFFKASLARMADERRRFMNAVRANPKVIGYSMTGLVDQGGGGEGLWTAFRELKKGTSDALFDGLAPLRWCNFVEPVNVYRNTPVRLEAVLANEDVLSPGKYPVRLIVVGPKGNRAFEKQIEITIPEKTADFEPPMVIPTFDETVVIDGPPGKYHFLTEFESGGAAMGGDAEFYVADPVELPPVDAEIVVWGKDSQVVDWLDKNGIKHKPFNVEAQTSREAILALDPPKENTREAFIALAGQMARGSTVIFPTPSALARDQTPVGWMPLEKKGGYAGMPNWLYHKEEWCKAHPIFEGLPSCCLMDYTFYRELIPDNVFYVATPPDEAIAGATQAAIGYGGTGLMLCTYRFNEGRFLINSLLIRENLGKHPAADRLLRNMLRWAAADSAKPLAALPIDYEGQIHALGY